MGYLVSRDKITKIKGFQNFYKYERKKITHAAMAEVIGITELSLSKRIIRVQNGEKGIDYIYQDNKRKYRVSCMVDGEEYFSSDICELTGLARSNAVYRIQRYNDGAIGKRELFKVPRSYKRKEPIEPVEEDEEENPATELEKALFETDEEGMKRRQKARDKEYNMAMRSVIASTRSCMV